MPKAGSTSIQAFLQSNMAELRTRGISYVEPASASSLEDLFTQVTDGVSAMLASTNAKDISVVVVSHESILEADPGAVSEFLEQLVHMGMEIDVVVVTRRLADWVVSMENQRLRTLKGSRGQRVAPVDRWFATWMAPQVTSRLASPVQFIDLGAPEGLLRAFAAASHLDIPDELFSKSETGRNRSASGNELAVYMLLDDALTVALRATLDEKRLLKSPRFREIRKFLRLLLGDGDHHRKPRDLGLDSELRLQLLLHFVDDFGDALVEGLTDEERDSRREISMMIKDARGVLAGTRASDDVRLDALSRFAERASRSVPATEAVFGRWCKAVNRPDLAALLLGEPKPEETVSGFD